MKAVKVNHTHQDQVKILIELIGLSNSLLIMKRSLFIDLIRKNLLLHNKKLIQTKTL